MKQLILIFIFFPTILLGRNDTLFVKFKSGDKYHKQEVLKKANYLFNKYDLYIIEDEEKYILKVNLIEASTIIINETIECTGALKGSDIYVCLYNANYQEIFCHEIGHYLFGPKHRSGMFLMNYTAPVCILHPEEIKWLREEKEEFFDLIYSFSFVF